MLILLISIFTQTYLIFNESGQQSQDPGPDNTAIVIKYMYNIGIKWWENMMWKTEYKEKLKQKQSSNMQLSGKLQNFKILVTIFIKPLIEAISML